MTRKATLGVLVVTAMLVTTGLAAVGSAATTDAGDAATTSSAPLAQETTEEENETDDGGEMGNETEMQGNESENATASITFDDQPSNGSVVVVNETNLSEGGFLVILNGSASMIGNSSYLEPGTHENVTVQLDIPLDESGAVVAVPHLDTNDNQTFDYNATMAEEVGAANATDGPYLEDGAPGGSTAFVTVGNETTSRSMDVPRVDP